MTTRDERAAYYRERLVRVGECYQHHWIWEQLAAEDGSVFYAPAAGEAYRAARTLVRRATTLAWAITEEEA